MTDTPITPAQTDALAKIAEIPPAGSHDRLNWLLEAERCGFERTSGGEEIPEYDPPAYFATRDELLTLMAEARKQGQRDVLGGMPGEDTEDERANALQNCAEAVAFFDQVKHASSAEQVAVGADHWNWLESACRRAAALATGGAR